MILSVHTIVGAALASLVPSQPLVALSIGLVSHLALDAIPHKDYKLHSAYYDSQGRVDHFRPFNTRYLIYDAFKLSVDASLGIIVSFFLFFDYLNWLALLAGIIGAVLPDFLTFICIFLKPRLMMKINYWHTEIIHARISPRVNHWLGVLLQYGILILILLIIKNINIW